MDSINYTLLRSGSIVKPNGIPSINWNHPMTYGLVWYGFDTGAGPVDLVVGEQAKYVDANRVGSGTSIAGSGRLYDGTASVYFNRHPTTSGALSWATSFVQTGNVGSFSRPWGRTANNGGSAPFVNYDFEINPSGSGQNVISMNICNAVDALDSATLTSSNSQNVRHSCCCTHNGSTTWLGYFDGVLAHDGSPVGSGDHATNSAICFSGSSDAAAGAQFIGYVFYGAVWNRVLSPNEILTLHITPYVFLEWPVTFIGFTAAAVVASIRRRPNMPMLGM